MPSIIIMGENALRQRLEYEFFFPSMKFVHDREDEGEMKFVPNMIVHAFRPKANEVKEGYENRWIVNINGLSFTPFLQEKTKDKVTARIRKFLLSLGDRADNANTFVLNLPEIWSDEIVEYGDTIGTL